MKTRNHLKTPNSKEYEYKYIYSIHSSELEVQAIDIKSTVIFITFQILKVCSNRILGAGLQPLTKSPSTSKVKLFKFCET